MERSSSYWHQRSEFRVIDPDGWDRSNLVEDWCRPITEREFSAKLMVSTVTDARDTSFGAGMAEFSCGDEGTR